MITGSHTGPKHHYTVRAGTEHAGVRYCETCGNVFYFAMGEQYLYPAPPQNIELFGTGGVAIDFFTTPELAMKIQSVVKEKKWRRVEFTELPILDAPQDGLGDLDINKFMKDAAQNTKP